MRIWWPFSWKGVSENPGLPTPFNKLPKLLSQVAMSTERWSVPAQLCWPHLPALVPWGSSSNLSECLTFPFMGRGVSGGRCYRREPGLAAASQGQQMEEAISFPPRPSGTELCHPQIYTLES